MQGKIGNPKCPHCQVEMFENESNAWECEVPACIEKRIEEADNYELNGPRHRLRISDFLVKNVVIDYLESYRLGLAITIGNMAPWLEHLEDFPDNPEELRRALHWSQTKSVEQLESEVARCRADLEAFDAVLEYIKKFV